VRVVLGSQGVVEVGFVLSVEPAEPADAERDEAALAPYCDQLHEYFAGSRTDFEMPLAPGGTPFQRAVWAQTSEIPYGATRTYGQIAAALGKPGAARGVGAALGRNPIGVVVPCHRVVGQGGDLVGYAGGLPIKRALLALEAERRAP
jgi:methylated-DNA-[protein]-cysteine S-methyltransferase